MKIRKSTFLFSQIFAALLVFIATIGIVNPFGFFAYADMRKLNESVRLVKDSYYENVDNQTILDGAASGIASSLKDPYSEYINTKQTKDFIDSIEGSFTGIGLYLKQGPGGFVTVVQPIDGSPAAKAGIEAGDKIIAVNGKEVKDVYEASGQTLGEPGTTVTVTILKHGTDKKVTMTLTRTNIPIKSVKHKILAGNVGYIRITQFSASACADFSEAMRSMKAASADKIIIDLRNNPGGIFEDTIKMLDLFIPDGNIIIYRVDKRGKKYEYKATKREKSDAKLTILINEDSASASEIFAAAMKDYKKAVLVGKKTFGKGVVQKLSQMSDGSIFKITVSKYYTPSGVCIDKEGVEPDIEIESNIIGNLDYDLADAELFAKDNQLQTALSHLKNL
jgi:carboxyl-terminal processing protease